MTSSRTPNNSRETKCMRQDVLEQTHRLLDIHAWDLHYAYGDSMHVRNLKKQKLRLRDEIERRQQGPTKE